MSVSILYCVDKRMNGKDSEGSSYGLIKTLPHNLPEGAEETHEKSQL
jgi:hypothetical protein